MQEQIIPIDILEKFENENSLSSPPADDLLYVFCPNTDISNNISSYSAYGMTVGNLMQLYEDLCNWTMYNELLDKLYALSGYYYNDLRPMMLSTFMTPAELTGTYMCRIPRTANDFPYKTDTRSTDSKQTSANYLDPIDYTKMLKSRTKNMIYHEWADWQTKETDISALAWLAPGPAEKLNNPNAVANDKYLEYRRQFIISLLQNRKRVIMAQANLYSQAIKVSREIRYDNTEYEEEYIRPDLKPNEERKIDENPDETRV